MHGAPVGDAARPLRATTDTMSSLHRESRAPKFESQRRRELLALATPAPRRRTAGELTSRAFLTGMLEQSRVLLPEELRDFHWRHQGSLVKVFYDDPALHFETWLHRRTAKVELGLHFESRDRQINAQLLDYFTDEMPFLKSALSERIEAETWDRGWTRVYHTVPFESLLEGFQRALAGLFASTIELLEPMRRDAVAHAQSVNA